MELIEGQATWLISDQLQQLIPYQGAWIRTPEGYRIEKKTLIFLGDWMHSHDPEKGMS